MSEGWYLIITSDRCPFRYTAGLMNGSANSVPYTACSIKKETGMSCNPLTCPNRSR